MSHKYQPELDGLRAVAVLLVVVFHFDIFSAGKAGFIGVDIFFVLSGFLITRIIAQDLQAGSFSMRVFLYRRMRRLYPSMLTVLALYLVAGYFLFLPDRFLELGKEALLSQLYVVNIYFWQNVNYFGLQASNVPLLHMWSLAVEEQFYLLFPFVMMAVHRFAPRLMLPAVAAACLVSFALGLMLSGSKPAAAFYLLPTRAWQLLAGSVLALVVLRRAPQGRALSVLGPLGMGLIIAALVIHTPSTPVPGWFALLPTLGTVGVIVSVFHPSAWLSRGLAWGPMVLIGRISYALYLVHWPILILLTYHLTTFTVEWRIAGALASVAAAWVIYIAIETPIRSGRLLGQAGSFLGVAGGSIAALVALSGLVIWGQGAPSRFPDSAVQALAYAEDQPTQYAPCEYRSGGLQAGCQIGDPSAAPSVLVLGDSHARAFAGAFDLWLKAEGKGGRLIFSHGCLPVRGAGIAKCQRFTQNVLDALETDSYFEQVILTSIWLQPYEKGGLAFDGRWYPASQTQAPFKAALQGTVATLSDAGKSVVLVEPFFNAPRAVPESLAKNLAFGKDLPLDTPLARHNTQFAQLFDAFNSVDPAQAQRISLIDGFCTEGLCKSLWDGQPVFSDNNHVAFSMSPVLAATLAQQMSKSK